MTDIATHIGNWKKCVAGWPFDVWPEAIETHDESEYRRLSNLLDAAMKDAKAAGYPCGMSGTQNNSGGKKMWIVSGTHRLTIAFVPKPRKQAVKPTSAAAYHSLNFDTVRGKVALCILEASANGGDITRNEIVERTGIAINSVCPRVSELMECKAIRIEGKDYRLIIAGKRKTNVPGAPELKNEALRFVEAVAQGMLF